MTSNISRFLCGGNFISRLRLFQQSSSSSVVIPAAFDKATFRLNSSHFSGLSNGNGTQLTSCSSKDDGKMLIREAKHGDYEAVMKMASTDTFRDGFDYLPAKFHQYVDDPNVFVLVTEEDDCLAVIYVYMFNDDGEALLAKTGRQNPKFKGMGTSRRMRQAALMMFKHFLLQRCKPTTLLRGVGEAHRMDVRKVLVLMGLWPGKEKCNFDVMYLQADVSAIQSSLASSNTPAYLLPLTPYQPPDLHRLLPPAFSAAVLPEGRVFVGWDPYKLSESNMKKFVEAGCYILVDPTEPAAKSLRRELHDPARQGVSHRHTL
ncbi:probable N-acetyltransferase 16 [Branchiostoma lanceolatum]|uniref:probable N-acetyltransferase 16 n=1 Tax=Branchiostoma lanceolatum TaxID=7740 RepID=UPI00345320CE